MRAKIWLALLGIVLALLPCVAVSEEVVAGGPAGTSEKRISMEFKEVPTVQALTMLSKAAEVSYAIQGEIPKDLRVTVYLHNATPQTAFKLVCDSAGLECTYNPVFQTFVISPRATVSMSGVQVPVLGAMTASRGAGGVWIGGAPAAGSSKPFVGLPYQGNSIVREKMMELGVPNQPFEEDGRLVDLSVRNAPLRDALAEMADSVGVIIDVDKSAPKDLKVTATIKNVMFDEALFLLTSQANLIFQVVGEKDGKTVIRVSPPPMMHATVSGVKGQPQCAKCGYPVFMADWKYCPKCGAALAKANPASKGGAAGRGKTGSR